MDPTTRFYLVLTAAMTALGALLSFTLAWELRDKSPSGTRIHHEVGAPVMLTGMAYEWRNAPPVPQPPALPAPPPIEITS